MSRRLFSELMNSGASLNMKRLRIPLFLTNKVKQIRNVHSVDASLSTAEWESNIGGSILRVVTSIDDNLTQIRKSREKIQLWDKAFGVIQSIALSPRKHLFRPQLVVLGYAGALNSKHALKAPPEGVIYFATGIELQHLFMLVHDDMMDRATFRRGEETLTVALARSDPNLNLNQETVQYLATIVGDILFARSSELMIKGATLCDSADSVDIVLEGAYRAGAAQFEDIIGWSGLGNKSENNLAFERIMSDKAAYHGFVAPLIAGIRLAPRSKNQKELETVCKSWALRAGAAFQGIDDISDLTQSPVETGKDQLQDIHEGRLSLPLFLLRDRASDNELDRVADILRESKKHNSALAIPDRHFLIGLIDKYNVVQASSQMVEEEIKAAENIISMNKELFDEMEVMRGGLQVFNDGLRKANEKLSVRTA